MKSFFFLNKILNKGNAQFEEIEGKYNLKLIYVKSRYNKISVKNQR